MWVSSARQVYLLSEEKVNLPGFGFINNIKCSPNQSMIHQSAQVPWWRGSSCQHCCWPIWWQMHSEGWQSTKCTSTRFTNIATGKTSPAITPFHLFGYDQVSNFLDKLANFPCPRTKIFRIFFGFQIVLYGGCDGGSCKKNQKSQCFVHFLIFLMVREWIYVDVDRPRFQENIHTIGSTDHQVQLLNGFAIFHTSWVPWQVWKIAKPFKSCTQHSV